MSVNFYLGCHDCRKTLWIAQDGLSGFGFYSGEPHCMKALRDFLADHALSSGHRLEFLSEHRQEVEDYEEIEWPRDTDEPVNGNAPE